MCNPGDYQIGQGLGPLHLSPGGLSSGTRVLYLAIPMWPNPVHVPQGVHCNDPLSCNPGDTQIPQWTQDCAEPPNSCYFKRLCSQQSIICRYAADAGVDAGASDASAGAVDTGVDVRTIPSCGNGILEPNTVRNAMTATPTMVTGAVPPVRSKQPGCAQPQDTRACPVAPMPVMRDRWATVVMALSKPRGCDCGDGTIPVPGGCPGANKDNTYGFCTTTCTWGPRCGDGILEPGEQCDMGSLNGLVLDASGNPTDAGGCPSCSTDCRILLCVF